MNQLCKVCGEPAAGFHFGAFTCEGCKSFFGRTYNNIAAIAGCKNNGDCVINKKNRTACKACRLRKCLLVGMSKSGSRYGRRSNWFKIHCLLQEQQSSGSNATGMGSDCSGTGTTGVGGNNNNNTCSLEQLARLQQASSQARQTYQDKTNPCIKSAASAALSPTLALQAAAAAAAAAAASTAATSNSGSTTSTHGITSASSNLALNFPHFLQAAKFLNGQHNHHHQHHHQPHHPQSQLQPTHSPHFKNDSRLTNTPSDSGASSAGDPANDDCTSLTKGTAKLLTTTMMTTTPTTALTTTSVLRRNCNSVQPPIESLHESHERRRKELLEMFRSHSEPLRSAFAPFALPSSLLACTPPTPTPTYMHTHTHTHTHLGAPLPATVFDFKAEMHSPTTDQDQPIDLSLKSTRTSRTHTPTSCASPASALDGAADIDTRTPTNARSCSETPPNDAAAVAAAFVRKSTPLDLTLVRSTQTLTG